MNKIRAVSLIVSLVFVGAACGQTHEDARDVHRFLTRTDNAPHVLRYTEQAEGRTVEVVLRVDDSFRSSETLSVNGQPLVEEVVSDDAAAVRLLAPDKWNPGRGTPLEPILGSGKWVLDPAGAPQIFFVTLGQHGITDAGKDELADAQNAFQYVRAVADQALTISKFNKTDLFYRPSLDPFKNLVERDERRGIKRYDAVPPVLPRTAAGGRQGAGQLPDSRFFRKLSIYVKGGQVVRVLEVVNFERHEEIRKAERLGKPKYLLRVLTGLRKGLGENPVRQRRMSIEVLSAGRPVKIALPRDAVQANIGSLLRSAQFAQLPGANPNAPAPPAGY
jgi:hypothetical protein